MRICCAWGARAGVALRELFVAGMRVPKSDRLASCRSAEPPLVASQREGQRPLACAPRRTMQVDEERATRTPAALVMSHSNRPTVLARLTTFPTARNFSLQTGRKKLIFSSRVVKDSPSSRVEAKETPMAAAATLT